MIKVTCTIFVKMFQFEGKRWQELVGGGCQKREWTRNPCYRGNFTYLTVLTWTTNVNVLLFAQRGIFVQKFLFSGHIIVLGKDCDSKIMIRLACLTHYCL